MNKKLHFSSPLVNLVLSGRKTVTWRLWDDKDLKVGDIVDCLESGTEKNFATFKIIKVNKKKMGKLTINDKEGHEDFKNEKEMYRVYSNYYEREVTPDTLVKNYSLQINKFINKEGL